jgi:hypothetical protein
MKPIGAENRDKNKGEKEGGGRGIKKPNQKWGKDNKTTETQKMKKRE